MDNTAHNIEYKLVTMTDGQQVLVMESPSVKVDMGVILPTQDETVIPIKRETINTDLKEFKHLQDQAMTKHVEVDTMTGKAQAVMNRQTPKKLPHNPSENN